MRFVSLITRLFLAALVMFTASVIGQGAARAAGDAQKGKVAYIKYGCWQCHDFAGEGSIATSGGKVLGRTAQSLDAFKTFVRTTNGAMPPYRPAVLSDDELADIYAYLQSLPQPKAASDIPLLNDARSK